jgi:hypothetical protein
MLTKLKSICLSKTNILAVSYNTQLLFTFFVLFIVGCNFEKNKVAINRKNEITCEVTCTDSMCIGKYTGPEFIDSIDTAHRLSNLICDSVGEKLKKLYKNKNFARVDLNKISISTKGMGDKVYGVTYIVKVPLVQVAQSCAATTSFDHSGGWNHIPELNKRKAKLLSGGNVLCEKLEISNLIKTKENLQEYWIQWRNSNYQNHCKCQ